MSYLENFIPNEELNKIDNFKKMKVFFEVYSLNLEIKHNERLEKFSVINRINTNDKKFIEKIDKKIDKVENRLKKILDIDKFDTDAIKKIYSFSLKYLNPFKGIFLKKEKIRKILNNTPLTNLKKELGDKLYNKYLENNPILLRVIGDFSEEEHWCENLKNNISNFSIDDFEFREIELISIDYTIFKKFIKKVDMDKYTKKYRKILGVYCITNLPILDKRVVLKTILKIFYDYNEIKIYNDTLQQVYKNYKEILPEIISNILKANSNQESLFSSNKILDGLAYKYINKKIKNIILDYPYFKILKNIDKIINYKNDSFSILGLIFNNNSTLLKNDILAHLLIEYYSLKQLRNGLISSFLDGENNVLNSINRDLFIKELNSIKLTSNGTILIYNNDINGISSSFIIEETLKELNIEVYKHSLEIIVAKSLKTILEQYPPQIPLFILNLGTDIVYSLIENKEERDVTIIDNNQYTPIKNIPENIHILNPKKYNLNSTSEGNSSIIAYLFSLSKLKSQKYSEIALLGISQNTFMGIDSYPWFATTLYLNHKNFLNDEYKKNKNEKSELINLISSVGYRSYGTDLAFQLINNKIQINDPRIKALKNKKNYKYEKVFLNFMKNGIEEREHCYIFNVDKSFHPMSIKEIDNFISFLKKYIDELPCILDKNKYLIGIQKIVPLNKSKDFTDKSSLKISIQLGNDMEENVKNKIIPNLFQITNSFENIHKRVYSSKATTIIYEKDYKSTIDSIENFISNYKNKK